MSREPATFRAMGVAVVVSGAGEEELGAIRRLFEDWDQIFSRFLPGSELNRVNADASPVVVLSRPFAHALRVSLDAAAATDGLVDPTLGAAIEAAGYDRDFALLADDDQAPGTPAPGRRHELRLAGRLLSRPPGTLLDLNGVVKALAADAALDLIGGDGFVSAGGDVGARGSVVVGLPAGGSVLLREGGVATSGTTKRRWRRGGELLHHLIDPRTGRPACSCWDEVTVSGGSCVAADVAAKAAFLLSEEGPDWLDERGLPGRFLSDGAETVNRAWAAAMQEAAA